MMNTQMDLTDRNGLQGDKWVGPKPEIKIQDLTEENIRFTLSNTDLR